jgi:hypothetical protein
MPETLKIHLKNRGSAVRKSVLNLRKRLNDHTNGSRVYRSSLSHSLDGVVFSILVVYY